MGGAGAAAGREAGEKFPAEQPSASRKTLAEATTRSRSREVFMGASGGGRRS
jgi:hypothetical protein